jgi:phospholipid/cholesterol/gamma-HCH transport system ATP-binding protein
MSAVPVAPVRDPKAARKLADYLAVVHEGRLVASGDADEVFASDDPFVRQFVTGEVSGSLGLSDPSAP